MSAQVHSFAIAYSLTRGARLLPRTLCSCGCGRTVSAVDRVCMYVPKGETLARVYYDECCFFQEVQRRSTR